MSEPAANPVDDETLSDALAARLDALAAKCPIAIRLAILRADGHLPPHGTPLSQAVLAAALGLSRWEVRQAEQRGLRETERKLFSPDPNNPTDPQP